MVSVVGGAEGVMGDAPLPRFWERFRREVAAAVGADKGAVAGPLAVGVIGEDGSTTSAGTGREPRREGLGREVEVSFDVA